MDNFLTDISGIRPKVSQSKIAKIITDTTSGTTGAGKRVYYTENDLNKTVEVFMAGISEMNPKRTLIGFPDTGEWSLGRLIAEALKNLGAEPVMIEAGMTYREMTGVMAHRHTESFIGFPQTLLALQRITDGGFENGLISGDYCIKADYMCPVFPHYGSREMGLAGAISCRERNGMHMRRDVDIEIVDENGNALPDGTEGELVITTHLEAMPLERYKTGDFTYIMPGNCPCGDSSVRIGPVRRKSPMETMDDSMFADSELIDWRGDIRIYKKDLDSKSRPLYAAKRFISR